MTPETDVLILRGMDTLTEREDRVLRLIGLHQEQHGVPPTHRELQKSLKVNSASSVTRTLLMLTRAGYIRNGKGHRTLRLTPKGLKLVLT